MEDINQINGDTNNHTLGNEIVDFFEEKVKNIKKGQPCKLYKAYKDVKKIEKEIAEEKDENKLHKLIVKKAEKLVEYKQLRKDAPSTEIKDWLSNTCEIKIDPEERITKVTHATKFTNGSAKPEGILIKTKSDAPLVTTDSLRHPEYDFIYSNGILITLARFLAIKVKGKLIYDLILDRDFSFLEPFSADAAQLEKWKKGFSALVEKPSEMTSAYLQKQIYFKNNNSSCKVEEDCDILIPLYSSSLAERVNESFTHAKYSDEQVKVREAKRNHKYNTAESVAYPDSSEMHFGGSKPHNISKLNADRGGNTYLFSSQPPEIKSKVKPPVDIKSFFYDIYSPVIKETVQYLREFLLRFQKLDLSIKNPKRKKWVDEWVNQIIGEVVNYVISIQNLPSGWSKDENTKLKLAHKYFLDPYLQDENFQKARKELNWKEYVCKDFADWLNHMLKGKNNVFTPQPEHTQMWIKLMEKELMEQTQVIEWNIKNQRRIKSE